MGMPVNMSVYYVVPLPPHCLKEGGPELCESPDFQHHRKSADINSVYYLFASRTIWTGCVYIYIVTAFDKERRDILDRRFNAAYDRRVKRCNLGYTHWLVPTKCPIPLSSSDTPFEGIEPDGKHYYGEN